MRILQAMGRGYLRGILISAISMLVGIPTICICLLAPALTYANTGESLWLVLTIAGGLAFFLITLGGGGTAIFFLARKRAARLDEVFRPLGLEGRSFLLNGRQYHGAFQGREAHVYFYRGPALDGYLATTANARLGAGLRSAVSTAAAGLTGSAPLETSHPALGEFTIFPEDREWASRLLANSAAAETLARLAMPKRSYEIRTLAFQPGSVQLMARYLPESDITPEMARGMLEGLRDLAAAAETIPPPARTKPLTDLERKSRESRSDFTIWGIVIALLLIAGMFVCSLLAVVIGLSLA